MRILIVECSVEYLGRGKTQLPKAIRMLMAKRDGSVSLHSDDRAYKPLNWMLPPCLTQIDYFQGGEGEPIQRWTVTNKNEELIIDIFKIISEDNHTLAEQEPGLKRSWTERQLQSWLAGHVEEAFGLGWSFIAREYNTGAGPVDLLVRDPQWLPVAVEVKRSSNMSSIYQAIRYVDALQEDPEMVGITGLVIALKISPRSQKLADDRNIRTIEIPAYLYRD